MKREVSNSVMNTIQRNNELLITDIKVPYSDNTVEVQQKLEALFNKDVLEEVKEWLVDDTTRHVYLDYYFVNYNGIVSLYRNFTPEFILIELMNEKKELIYISKEYLKGLVNSLVLENITFTFNKKVYNNLVISSIEKITILNISKDILNSLLFKS